VSRPGRNRRLEERDRRRERKDDRAGEFRVAVGVRGDVGEELVPVVGGQVVVHRGDRLVGTASTTALTAARIDASELAPVEAP
jgi:hypothetical protein